MHNNFQNCLPAQSGQFLICLWGITDTMYRIPGMDWFEREGSDQQCLGSGGWEIESKCKEVLSERIWVIFRESADLGWTKWRWEEVHVSFWTCSGVCNRKSRTYFTGAKMACIDYSNWNVRNWVWVSWDSFSLNDLDASPGVALLVVAPGLHRRKSS